MIRFSSVGPVMAFASSSALFTGLPDDWERHGKEVVRFDPATRKATFQDHKYPAPRRISEADAMGMRRHPDGLGYTAYDDRSPARIRRTKAVGAALVTGAVGYAAGKHGKAAMGSLKNAAGSLKKSAAKIGKGAVAKARNFLH